MTIHSSLRSGIKKQVGKFRFISTLIALCRFGSGIRSPSLGIVFNSQMDDFSTPGLTNFYHVRPSPRNYIKPGKRMMCSMSPTIIVDKSGRVRLVVGAAGGPRIPTAIAQIVADYLWFGKGLKEAVIAPRIHHQLLPLETSIEGSDQANHWIADGLARRGHAITFFTGITVVQVVAVDKTGKISAMSDPRKFGRAAGY